MPGFLIRLAVNSVAVWVATQVAGLQVTGVGSVVLTAVALGLVNALIRPMVLCILGVLTLPLQIVTLGLFTLVLTLLINGFMLWLALWIVASVGGAAATPDFWTAVVGAIVISIVSWLLSLMVR